MTVEFDDTDAQQEQDIHWTGSATSPSSECSDCFDGWKTLMWSILSHQIEWYYREILANRI